jgi:hypothetical protein
VSSPTTADRIPGAGLGAVIYDLHLLAGALLAERDSARDATGALPQGDRHRLAAEIMLIKCRALLELMSPSGEPYPDDIRIEQLGLQAQTLPPLLDDLRRFVNKRSAHLTWQRAVPDLDTWQDLHGESIAATARTVFDLVCQSVLDKALAAGITPVYSRHGRFLSALTAQRQALRPLPPLPDGA